MMPRLCWCVMAACLSATTMRKVITKNLKYFMKIFFFTNFLICLGSSRGLGKAVTVAAVDGNTYVVGLVRWEQIRGRFG